MRCVCTHETQNVCVRLLLSRARSPSLPPSLPLSLPPSLPLSLSLSVSLSTTCIVQAHSLALAPIRILCARVHMRVGGWAMARSAGVALAMTRSFRAAQRPATVSGACLRDVGVGAGVYS